MTETPPDLPGDPPVSDVTLLLRRLEEGDAQAGDELFRQLYPDLRRRAEAQMRGQAGSHTLQPTALVHEAFLRLAKPGEHTFENRRHFLLTASRAMRHVLIDHARGKQRIKRAGNRVEQPIDELQIDVGDESFDLEALELAMADLDRRDPTMAQAIELRFFAGLDVKETAEILKIPARTFDRRWQACREWLRARLEE